MTARALAVRLANEQNKLAHMKEYLGPNTQAAKLCQSSPNLSWDRDLLTIGRYIGALEERVAFLEARLPDHAKDHLESTSGDIDQSPLTATDTSYLPSHDRRNSCRESQAGSNSEDVDIEDGTSLVEGVAYLSLCAAGTTDTNREPYYVGSSSGATIARVIQSSIYRRLGTAGLTAPPQDVPVTSPTVQHVQPTCSELDVCESALPDQLQARMLFDLFFERIHPRWPLLDRAIYEDLFDMQYLPGNLTITQRSILHLIYAITARFLAVTKKPCGVDDEVGLRCLYRLRKS